MREHLGAVVHQGVRQVAVRAASGRVVGGCLRIRRLLPGLEIYSGWKALTPGGFAFASNAAITFSAAFALVAPKTGSWHTIR